MKAAVFATYGPPDVVQITDVEKPLPKDHEVLIKVRAASINPLDWHFVRGQPRIFRLAVGLRRPKVTRLGVDLAGQVEAVGSNVTQFKPADEVFGCARGAIAEYVCAMEEKLALKPANLSFEEAASVPVAALSALQGLRDKGRIQRGQNVLPKVLPKVLIEGASGGVGTFAVQIAKSFGAEVTAVCSTRNVDQARSIGATHVIDYTRQDFTHKCRALRPDSRRQRLSFRFRLPPRPGSARNLRHGRRRRGSNAPRHLTGTITLTARQQKAVFRLCKSKQQGFAFFERSSRSRESRPHHR